MIENPERFSRAMALFDAANSEDPNQDEGQPKELLYGRRMSDMIARFAPDGSVLALARLAEPPPPVRVEHAARRPSHADPRLTHARNPPHRPRLPPRRGQRDARLHGEPRRGDAGRCPRSRRPHRGTGAVAPQVERWFYEAATGRSAEDPVPPMFAPIRLRELELANRIVVSPMAPGNSYGMPSALRFVPPV